MPRLIDARLPHARQSQRDQRENNLIFTNDTGHTIDNYNKMEFVEYKYCSLLEAEYFMTHSCFSLSGWTHQLQTDLR